MSSRIGPCTLFPVALFSGPVWQGWESCARLDKVYYIQYILLHQCEKALELAMKNKTHEVTVLAYRLKYLARCDKEENNAK